MKNGLASSGRLFLAGITLFAATYLVIVLLPFPSLKEYMQREMSLEIRDGAGNLLYVAPLEDGMRRQYRPFEEIPPDVRRIFTLAEDKRFFLHPGIDPVALSRSAFRYLVFKDDASGASTITMQLARMVLNANGGRSGGLFVRKVQEMLAALRIEARLDKDRILELWLNNIPFGHQTEGVVAAARRFFNQDLYSLTTAQVLALALIPRNPTAYSPIDEPERVSAGVVRLGMRLRIALDPVTVSADVAEASRGTWPDEGPHFSRMVAHAVADAVADAVAHAEAAPAAGAEGVTGPITTTLDLDLQHFAEGLLYAHLDKSAGSRVENGAVLLIENATGSILAYVGSQGFRSAEGGQIDGVNVANQPGSTIKPFLYACALENGFGPNDILADIPTDFGTAEVYVPRNFDWSYHGPVRMRTSLASSLNIPATSMLESLGVRTFTSFLLDLGFKSLAVDGFSGYPSGGLGIALGNAPVTLFELVRAFSIFPRGGLYRELTWRPEPSATQTQAAAAPADPGGASPEVSPDTPANGRRVISQSTAWIIFDMLSDPAERVTGFGMTDPFYIGAAAAVKTGTSSKNQNIWALAANRIYTVGVWLGNFGGQTVIGRTGSSVPARIALEILEYLGPPNSREREPKRDELPAGVHPVEICSLSGMTAGPGCPATRIEYIEGVAPPLCTFHAGSQQTVRTPVFPAKFAPWAEESKRNVSFDIPPEGFLDFRYPVDGAVYFYDRGFPAGAQAIKVEVVHGGNEPELSVNGGDPAPPRSSDGVTSSWIVPLTPGTMSLEVRCGTAAVVRYVEVR